MAFTTPTRSYGDQCTERTLCIATRSSATAITSTGRSSVGGSWRCNACRTRSPALRGRSGLITSLVRALSLPPLPPLPPLLFARTFSTRNAPLACALS
eukprot:31392-Pelagococcus_subviridis.AAC.1